MLIFSKGDGEGRVLVVPALSEEDAQKTVHSKTNMVALFEGWNEIPLDLWPKCLPHLKDKIQAGDVKFLVKEDENGEYVQQTLWEVRADKAREVVKGCFNMKNLETWLTEPRLTAEIRSLVDIQIEACNRGEEMNKKKK